jgi:para-aminobenzoate synthetase/4-amino-4-deoxychorismate lyase
MWVVLDDAQGGLAFKEPLRLIRADRIEEVPAALAAMEAARAGGRWLAGWFAYELGYALEKRLERLMPAGGPLLSFGVFDAPCQGRPQTSGRAYAGPLRPEWDVDAYGNAFRAAKEYIEAGDIYQANLSFRASFNFAGDPYALYEKLRHASAAPHCAYIAESDRQILSLSPELFFELTADGALTARPMKGTVGRDAGGAALAASPKDRAENLMIVDLIRNDLGRIAEVGSVAVRDLFAVETYPTLHTMVSTVKAQLKPDGTIAAILGALFPCGSVTGAPKIRAMEILRELEASPRRAYCGAIGHFAPDGSARFNVAIRTLTLAEGRGQLGIGGGVVQDSKAQSEYAECLLKARFYEAARRPLDLIETLRFESDFVRLDSHLARMAGSASLFGLAFDARAARQALADCVAGRVGPLRVRLSLDEAGVHRASAAPLAPNPLNWRYAISDRRVHSGDLLLRHKTSWRDLYEAEAARHATDEVIFLNERDELAEGARSNIFIRCGERLLTPPLASGVLDGRLRAELIAQGRCDEAVLTEADLALADLKGEVWLGNSLRGLIPAVRVPDQPALAASAE